MQITVRYIVLIAFMLTPTMAGAEFTCRGEVSYKWKTLTSKLAADKDSPAKESEERVVAVGSIERRAPDETAAKGALVAPLERERSRALDLCRVEHENLSGCIANRFGASVGVLNTLGFSAKKALEEAITGDCRVAQGACTEVLVSEITCKESATPVPEETKGSESKKGEGKKK